MGKSVLYYPSININKMDWLSNALFYWDNIHSIVPDDYDRELFSPELKYLLDEKIFIPISPQILLKSNSYCDFESELLDKILWNRHEEAVNNIIHNVDSCHIGVAYLSKMRSEVWAYMKENNIIRRCFDKYALMNNNDLYLMMSLMAKYISFEYNLKTPNNIIIPSTDQTSSYKFAFNNSTYGKISLASSLNKILPTPIPNTPFERIVDFKQENRNELIRLRRFIDDYEEKVSKCKDISEIPEIINMFQDEIFIQLNELKTNLKKRKITYSLTSLRSIINVSMPSLLISMSDIPISLKALGLVANGAISLGTCYVDSWINREDDLKNSSVAYLYNAQKMGLVDFYNFN